MLLAQENKPKYQMPAAMAKQERKCLESHAEQFRGHAVVLWSNSVFLVPAFQSGSFADAAGLRILQVSKGEQITQSLARWKLNVYASESSADVDSISETVAAVFDALEQFGPGAIDLTDLEPSAFHPEHLAAVLRATYPARERVPGWKSALDLGMHEAAVRGESVGEIFFGLTSD